jgi:hypothetical protein
MPTRGGKSRSGVFGHVGSRWGQNGFGLNVPASTFTVISPACGNQVSATYTFEFMASVAGLSSVTLTAQSCFPK